MVDKGTAWGISDATVKQTGKKIVSKSIGVIVDTAYSQTVQSFGIETNEIVDKVVVSATSKAVNEIIRGWLNKQRRAFCKNCERNY